MHSRPFSRLTLVTLLALGVGVATEATALASAPGSNATAAVDKKKPKKHKATTIKLANSSLGKIVVDSKGRSLYAFDLETTITDAKCRSGCDTIWPELKAPKPTAGKGLDKSLLQVGADGQVAYNGHLLYRYAADTKAGDMGGQGIGNVWHVVNAAGAPVKA
jgi:predicted lipoprotein with Yx(FWY)xxD motif